MPRTASHVVHTDRDTDIYFALALTPLTVHQLWYLSSTFAQPFPSEHAVRDRLQRLRQSTPPRVRKFYYATQGPGMLPYYTLSPLGYQLLKQRSRHRYQVIADGKPTFQAVSDLNQRHTWGLANLIVHTLAAAHRSGLILTRYVQENRHRVEVAGQAIKPDGSMWLWTPLGEPLQFFLEYHRDTRRNRIPTNPDSWEFRVPHYEAFREQTGTDFRVLAFTETPEDLRRILDTTQQRLRNPRRRLVYAALEAEYLACAEPLRAPIFRDHHDQVIALLPSSSRKPSPRRLRKPAAVMAQPAAVC